MGLILAPNERWNSILHMRVERDRFRLSGVRVSNTMDLIKEIGLRWTRVHFAEYHLITKTMSLFNGLSSV